MEKLVRGEYWSGEERMRMQFAKEYNMTIGDYGGRRKTRTVVLHSQSNISHLITISSLLHQLQKWLQN